MELYIEKREELQKLKNKYQKKIFMIENELIKIEKEMSKFSETQIIDSLTLSDDQKEIVEAKEDNILVIACPGAGKTHTLVSRYVNLILKQNVNPEGVLLITFTKKAGQEMLNRLQDIIPDKLPFHVGSLHGLAYRIIQQNNNINYTILDEMETKELLNQETNKYLLNIELLEDEKMSIKNKIVSIIDQVCITYPLNFKLVLKKYGLEKKQNIINQIYKNFIKRKKQENSLDFNDLMIMLCDYLKNPKNEIIDQIKYIFFDEYQDINPIQNYILSMFKNRSKIMVIGDDAQSIYSFRGSSVKYIWDFPKIFTPNKIYLLVDNYRSSPSIVNFCQNIIEKNVKQYEKKVKSIQSELGIKPDIHGFNGDQQDQYIWVINDIIKKINDGVLLSNIVILSRKISSLISIELGLVKAKIPYVKNPGGLLLDKVYIKDFLAFIIILYNPKSSIHWKRIISLHKGYNINMANNIVENNDNIYETIKGLSNTNVEMYKLVNLLNNVNKIEKDNMKAKLIINYLEKLWEDNNKVYPESSNDLITLLYYLKNNSNLQNFINDIYLNQDINTNIENSLCLSTIHGSKGLEWEHVYIIDMNNNDFPNIRQNYYLDELADMEEERRLFYVACSRAKKYLTITYHILEGITMSPFIREIDESLYLNNGIIKESIPLTIPQILKNIGYKNISSLLENLEIKEKIIHSEYIIPSNIVKLGRYIINNFMSYLIPKILQNNYPDKYKKFDLNLYYKYNNFPNKLYQDYIDKHNHWTNLLEEIMTISVYGRTKNKEYYNDFLLNNIDYYKNIEIGIKKMIDMFKVKTICNNYSINENKIDLLMDDIIVQIKVSNYNICNINNISNLLVYGYLLQKKNIKINKIILYNVENGTLYIIDTTIFNFENFYKLIYS